jgi:hypothetical protein
MARRWMKCSVPFLNARFGRRLRIFLEGRLKVILTSWTEHNKNWGEKFRKWMEKAERMKDEPIHNSISQTARVMEETNERLSQLLMELRKRD